MEILLQVVKPTLELVTPHQRLDSTMEFLETAGRTCYKSEKKITPESSKAFIRMLVKSGHLSVIEHEQVTIRFIGSRSMSHQLVRHRLAAYSQESQRYCDYSGGNKGGYQIVCPPKVANMIPGTYERKRVHTEVEKYQWLVTMDPQFVEVHGINPNVKEIPVPDEHNLEFLDDIANCFKAYERYRNRGVPAEDARCILPNATKTEVVTTFNLRTWRHVFEERALNAHAQWEIRELMQNALGLLHTHLPIIFEDQFQTMLDMRGKER